MITCSKVAYSLSARRRLLLCVVAGGVAGPGLPGLGGVAVDCQVAVSEGLGDDGGGGLLDEVAQGGGAGCACGDAELAQRRPQCVGVEGLPGPAAGERRRLAGLVAVLVFCRLAACRSSRPAKGSGTGTSAHDGLNCIASRLSLHDKDDIREILEIFHSNPAVIRRSGS